MKKIMILFLGLIIVGGLIWLIVQKNTTTDDVPEESSIEKTSSEKSTTDETSSENSANSNTYSSESAADSGAAEQNQSIESIIDGMSLEEKVGQLFFVRVPEGNEDGQIADIVRYHLGGYILFGRDVENETANSLKNKIADYQNASSLGMLIGMDEEGGTVSRLSQNGNLVTTPFQSPQALYKQGGLDAVDQDTAAKSEILHDYGITTGLFPVADVSTDPQSFIYDRTIGLDAQGTSEYVRRTVEVLKEHKIGSTLKHFPGYGNNRDSHVEIVRDTRSLEELEKTDFLPFEAGIAAGADSVLVSHNIVDSIDPNLPASISEPVHQLLRNDLNFDGVIMTDDMDMAGLADFISQEEAGLMALEAGNDLVMSSSYQQQIPYVVQAVKDGKYTETQLNASVKRVLKWKEKLGLID